MGNTPSNLGASEPVPNSPPEKKTDKPRFFGLTQVYPDPKDAAATEEKEIEYMSKRCLSIVSVLSKF